MTGVHVLLHVNKAHKGKDVDLTGVNTAKHLLPSKCATLSHICIKLSDTSKTLEEEVGASKSESSGPGAIYMQAIASLSSFARVMQDKLEYVMSKLNELNSNFELQINQKENEALQDDMNQINDEYNNNISGKDKIKSDDEYNFQKLTKQYANDQAQFDPSVNTIHGIVQTLTQELQSIEESLTEFIKQMGSAIDVSQFTASTINR